MVRRALGRRRWQGEARVFPQTLGIHHDGAYSSGCAERDVGLVAGRFRVLACSCQIELWLWWAALIVATMVLSVVAGKELRITPNPRQGVVPVYHGVEWYGLDDVFVLSNSCFVLLIFPVVSVTEFGQR